MGMFFVSIAWGQGPDIVNLVCVVFYMVVLILLCHFLQTWMLLWEF